MTDSQPPPPTPAPTKQLDPFLCPSVEEVCKGEGGGVHRGTGTKGTRTFCYLLFLLETLVTCLVYTPTASAGCVCVAFLVQPDQRTAFPVGACPRATERIPIYAPSLVSMALPSRTGAGGGGASAAGRAHDRSFPAGDHGRPPTVS